MKNDILYNLSSTRSELMFEEQFNKTDNNEERVEELEEHIDIITDRITLLINPS